MLTDDISIFTTVRNKTEADSAAQTEVEKVLQWSKSWKLQLNIGKSEVCIFFST